MPSCLAITCLSLQDSCIISRLSVHAGLEDATHRLLQCGIQKLAAPQGDRAPCACQYVLLDQLQDRVRECSGLEYPCTRKGSHARLSVPGWQAGAWRVVLWAERAGTDSSPFWQAEAGAPAAAPAERLTAWQCCWHYCRPAETLPAAPAASEHASESHACIHKNLFLSYIEPIQLSSTKSLTQSRHPSCIQNGTSTPRLMQSVTCSNSRGK